MCSYGFLPTISKATRVSSTSFTLLDNIFCNDISRITHSGVIKTDFSDHFTVFVATNISRDKIQYKKQTQTSFNYHYINDLKEYLITNLANLGDDQDPENACNTIINAYNEGISMFSHTKSCSRKSNYIKEWMSQGILCSINNKNRLFEKKT